MHERNVKFNKNYKPQKTNPRAEQHHELKNSIKTQKQTQSHKRKNQQCRIQNIYNYPDRGAKAKKNEKEQRKSVGLNRKQKKQYPHYGKRKEKKIYLKQ